MLTIIKTITNKRTIDNRSIVKLPTLLQGSFETTDLEMVSKITPGNTEIIGTIKVNVNRNEHTVKIVPTISPLFFEVSVVKICLLSVKYFHRKKVENITQENIEQYIMYIKTAHNHSTPCTAKNRH